VKFNTKAKKEKNPWYNVTLNGQNWKKNVEADVLKLPSHTQPYY
jgi:hypothetical protein